MADTAPFLDRIRPGERTVRRARKGTRNELAEVAYLRRRLDDFGRLVSDLLWETDARLRLTRVSSRAPLVIGRPPSELIGRRLTEICDFSAAPEVSETLFSRAPFREVPCEVVGADGERRQLVLSGLPAFDVESGAFQGFRGIAADVTEQRRMERALRRRDAVLQAVGLAAGALLKARDWQLEMPAIVSRLGEASEADDLEVFETVSEAGGVPLLRRRYHWPAPRDVPGDRSGETEESASAIFSGDDWPDQLRAGRAVVEREPAPSRRRRRSPAEVPRGSILGVPILTGDAWWGLIRLRRGSALGAWTKPESEAVKAAALIIGSAIHRHEVERDISEKEARFSTARRSYEDRLRHQAEHDPLTGLANRALFFEHLSNGLARAARHGHRLALLLVDLDQFKLINDSLGPRGGDQILCRVAERLSAWNDAANTMARLASDEFALVMTTDGDRAQLATLVERIAASLAEPLAAAGQEVYVHASIGIAVFPDDADNPPTLLKNAGAAMLRAKELGGNACQFFRPGMNAKSEANLILGQGLRQALPRQQFELFYQPLVDVRSQTLVAAEALLRWRHPELGLIPPGEFIGLAEDSGLIEPIGEWVLHEACRQNRKWQDEGLGPLHIAVNVSSRQLQRGRLLNSVFSALDEASIAPSCLSVEITESAVLADIEEAKAILERLAARGVGIAVDDFGTGYASLTYLRRLPLSTLKIDRAFVRDLTTDPDDAAIVDAIILMAHRLNLKVVAEGVEDATQLALLQERGCQMVQGYYFSPPVPAGEFAGILRGDAQIQPRSCRSLGGAVARR